MDLKMFFSIFSELGGFEAFKWGINAWRNRKTDARKQETAADSDEFHLLREQIEFLQTQLKEKELRFAEQTELVRGQNIDIINLTKEKAALELELALKRCERKQCTSRQPQNGY